MKKDIPSNVEENTIDLFEVFKIKTLSRKEIQLLPEEDLKKKYTLLVPIKEINQIENANALATLPLEGIQKD